MSAFSIQPTYPTFTDIDGQPLEDGYIFLGTINLDPIANPITAYFDAALTVTATQPIRTKGGYPNNAGAPGRIYVNSNYSIQAQEMLDVELSLDNRALVIDNDDADRLRYRSDAMVPILVKAIQELTARVAALETV